MNITQLQTNIEQATITNIIITRMPDTGDDFWFVYLYDSQSEEPDLLTTDGGFPLAFGTLDDVLHMATQWGYDGRVDVQWTKADALCN